MACRVRGNFKEKSKGTGARGETNPNQDVTLANQQQAPSCMMHQSVTVVQESMKYGLKLRSVSPPPPNHLTISSPFTPKRHCTERGTLKLQSTT